MITHKNTTYFYKSIGHSNSMTFHHLTGTYQKDGNGLKKIDSAPSVEVLPITEQELIWTMSQIPLDRAVLRQENMRLTRAAIRASVKQDLLIINTINNIEEIDKIVNTLAKRLREWFSLYDPELEHRLRDHRVFIDEVLSNKPRAAITMGGTLSEDDLIILHAQAARIRDMYEQRDKLLVYLEQVMQEYTPNIKRIAGATIGAKLLALSGSLNRMSCMASGTIQLLGAETALFRHLRNPRARPPKHGIIFNHIILQRAPKDMRGKAARVLADKISIAAKVDYFKGEYVGDELYAQIEKKMGGKL